MWSHVRAITITFHLDVISLLVSPWVHSPSSQYLPLWLQNEWLYYRHLNHLYIYVDMIERKQQLRKSISSIFFLFHWKFCLLYSPPWCQAFHQRNRQRPETGGAAAFVVGWWPSRFTRCSTWPRLHGASWFVDSEIVGFYMFFIILFVCFLDPCHFWIVDTDNFDVQRF